MKKFLSFFLCAVLLFALSSCGGNDGSNTTTKPMTTTQKNESATTESNKNENITPENIPDTMSTPDGKYKIAFVTDVGSLKDKSFNQGTWEGVKKFAYQNDKSYKYYQPASGDQATDEDRFDAMKTAAQSGAEIVICAGFLQSTALTKAAETFPECKFIFIDGSNLKGKDGKVLKNIAPVTFKEEQSGYLAGYAAVMDGYKKLGFTGGGGGTNPSCNRFGYGYLQGVNDAAKEKNITVDMNYSWEYGANFNASAELQTMLSGWYNNGTEVIFCSGGSMCLSVFAAAAANDGAVIGVDVDQSVQSDTVVTSALKKISESVDIMLKKFYDGDWSAMGGKETVLGIEDDAVALPIESWSMKNFTVKDYEKLYDRMKKGEIKVDNDYKKVSKDAFSNIKLSIIG